MPNESKVEQVQRRADALNKALIESSEKILGKRIQKKQPHWVSEETTNLQNAQDKAREKFILTKKPGDKSRWIELQQNVSVSYDKDQANFRDAQLKELITAAEKREYRNT